MIAPNTGRGGPFVESMFGGLDPLGILDLCEAVRRHQTLLTEGAFAALMLLP